MHTIESYRSYSCDLSCEYVCIEYVSASCSTNSIIASTSKGTRRYEM